MHLLLLPIRVPEECDLAEQLSRWLSDEGDDGEEDESGHHDDERQQRPAIPVQADSSQADLQYVSDLRHRVCRVLATAAAAENSTETVSENLELLQEYASALKQCCDRGFPVTDLEGEGTLALTWTCGITNQTETHCSLAWERGNLVYNMALVHIHRAVRVHSSSSQQPETRATWTATGQSLQHAATLLQYLRQDLLQPQKTGPLPSQYSNTICLQPQFLQIWETYCLAEAQYCAYSTFRLQPRPKHFLLAKLSACNLFQEVEELCQALQLDYDFILDWEDSVRAWGMWMSAVSEYHQSIVHKEKKEWGLELARLEGALKFASFCKDFCESCDSDLLDGLAGTVQPVLEEMDERFEFAEHENVEVHHEPIPEHDELPEITAQLTVKTDREGIHQKLLPALSRPLFTATTADANIVDPAVRRYVQTFRSDLQKLLQEAEQTAEEKTEGARSALAAVNLPHSLTVYRQEQQQSAGGTGGGGNGGGGIPDELWRRVQAMQRDQRHVEQLKQDLRQLQDMADTARSTFQRIGNILKEDSELDSIFRNQHPSFEGHSVRDIQRSFRLALQNYHRLMVSASESDTLLIRRSDMLETDPKFRLLKLPKAQLDRLVSTTARQPEIDVSTLSNYLVDLSALFNERDALLHKLQERGKTYNIALDLAECQGESEYAPVVERALASFRDLVDDLDANIEQQAKLLYQIMQENDQFRRLRNQESRGTPPNDSTLVKLEDALEEIELFWKHLREGRTFYDVVIPKLEKLQHQVRDVSNRLAQERQDYEEYSNGSGGSGGSGDGDGVGGGRYPSNTSNGMTGGYDPRGGDRGGRYGNDRPMPREMQPRGGAAQAYGRPPEVQVDDEKVANLVAMDFDPEKVVAALKRNDNNLEQALNDLLSC